MSAADRWSDVADRWSDQPWFDGTFALGIGTLAWITGWSPLERLEVGARTAVYASGASLVAIVGGLGSVAAAVYLSAPGPRMTELKSAHGRLVRRNLVTVMVSTFLAACLCWISQVYDGAGSRTLAWALAVAGVSWGLLTCIRQGWLFTRLMELSDTDEQLKPTAPQLSSRYNTT